MRHIELRDLDDDDLDAVFEMMRDAQAVEMTAFAPGVGRDIEEIVFTLMPALDGN